MAIELAGGLRSGVDWTHGRAMAWRLLVLILGGGGNFFDVTKDSGKIVDHGVF